MSSSIFSSEGSLRIGSVPFVSAIYAALPRFNASRLGGSRKFHSGQVHVLAAQGLKPCLDLSKQGFAMAFAAMPQQVDVEGILRMSDFAEVERNGAGPFDVARVAFADRAPRCHRAYIPMQALLRIHAADSRARRPVSARTRQVRKPGLGCLPFRCRDCGR